MSTTTAQVQTGPAFPDLDRLLEMRDAPSMFVEDFLEDDPWDFQVPMLDAPEKRQCIQCGRQVGKTRICAWRGLHKAVTKPGVTVLITSLTQRQSSELFRHVKLEIENSDFPDAAWQIDRETNTIIELANGSRIICLPTGVDGKTIRTYTADLVIVDEAAFISRVIFEDVLDPMLATTDGTMILASTPWGTRGYFYDACTKFDHFRSDHVTMAASPLISEDYIEGKRVEKSDQGFKQEVLGEFVESADAFLPDSILQPNFMDGADLQRSTERAFLGVDVARQGADQTVFTAIDDNGNVFYIYESDSQNLTDTMGRVRNLDAEYGFSTIHIDETGLGGGVVDTLAEDMYNVEGVKFTIDNKQAMYSHLRSLLESERINLPADRKLRRQLSDLEYELTSGGKKKIHHPEGGHDDYADSLALAALGLADADVEVNRRSPAGSGASKRSRTPRRSPGRS